MLREKLSQILSFPFERKNPDVNSLMLIYNDKLIVRTFYEFNVENAYSSIFKQTSFGPRVPGSHASIECKKWILRKLKDYGTDNITEQSTTLKAYNGDIINVVNISAQIYPNNINRVLLLAHWDTRPWADMDKCPDNRNKAIDGANDGASGVAIILELVRIFSKKPLPLGIDVLFVDAEDYGQRLDNDVSNYDDTSWCLGMQYWINNPTLNLSNIKTAIHFDMVGGLNATFPREYFSDKISCEYNDLFWNSVYYTEHSLRFPDKLGNAVIDDHVYLLLHKIPVISIVESSNPITGCFSPTWHTLGDNIKNIDINTLKAVGEASENFLKGLSFKSE